MNLIYKITAGALLLSSVVALGSQATACAMHSKGTERHCPKRTYIRADIGGSILEFGKLNNTQYMHRFRPSVVWAVGAGYEINNRIKTDFTVSNRAQYRYSYTEGANTATQSIKSTALMINGYYNVIEAMFTPYVMGGAGVAFNNAGDYHDTDGEAMFGKTNATFAWQVGTGLIYKLHDSAHIDLGYRYVSSNTANTSNYGVTSNGAVGLAGAGQR